MQFFALRRSGHHAIMNWVMWSIPGLVVFRNDRAMNQEKVVQPGRVQIYHGPRKLNISQQFADFTWNHFPLSTRVENFEDAENLEFVGGYLSVLVMRDFYNNMASRLKWEREIRSRFRDESTQEDEAREHMHKAKKLWKEYARVAISPPESVVVCHYDHWVGDEEYRKTLATSLGVSGHQSAIRSTAQYGPGSSFEGKQSTPDANKLTHRFELFNDDDFFIDFVRDDEIVELNDQLFGRTPSSQWVKGL